jgi:hypothetical protein
MKRRRTSYAFVLVLSLVALPALAQLAPQGSIPVTASKGDLAVALVRLTNGDTASSPSAEAALARVRSAAVFPREWSAAETLTQGDLAVVARSLGFTFTPSDSDRSVTTAQLDSFVLREIAPHKDDVATVMSAGRVIDPILDEPPDRFVSASEF